jgi:hypothetical protein
VKEDVKPDTETPGEVTATQMKPDKAKKALLTLLQAARHADKQPATEDQQSDAKAEKDLGGQKTEVSAAAKETTTDTSHKQLAEESKIVNASADEQGLDVAEKKSTAGEDEASLLEKTEAGLRSKDHVGAEEVERQEEPGADGEERAEELEISGQEERRELKILLQGGGDSQETRQPPVRHQVCFVYLYSIPVLDKRSGLFDVFLREKVSKIQVLIATYSGSGMFIPDQIRELIHPGSGSRILHRKRDANLNLHFCCRLRFQKQNLNVSKFLATANFTKRESAKISGRLNLHKWNFKGRYES